MENTRKRFFVEVVCLGNELLNGTTTNTNLTWIGKQITLLGLIIKRCTIVRDEKDLAVSAIKEAVDRHPRYLFVMGGLGPTFDDIQMEALSEAINKPLIKNSTAIKLLCDYYGVPENKLTPERLKMALIPKGATVIKNDVGAAPGVILKHKNTFIFSLPGVPREMKQIMLNHYIPFMKEDLEKNDVKLEYKEKKIIVQKIPESLLSPIITKWMKTYPWIYIKSHPSGDERHEQYITLQIYTYASISPEKFNDVIKQILDTIKKQFPNSIMDEI